MYDYEDLRYSADKLPHWRSEFMIGFYEELAEFAAMSEDDGFLGQCAGQISDTPPAAAYCSLPTPFIDRNRAQQLQLLTIPKRGLEPGKG
jgi:hypothetical protein